MSAKSAMIRARTEPKLKNEVESIFEKLGLNASEAINLFYKQVKLNRGIPFEIRIPNETTLNAMLESSKKLHSYKSQKDLFKSLELE